MEANRGEFGAGDRLGDFEIVRQIGRGGMGSVYLAEDTRLRRRVALKVILPELSGQADFRRRFEVEAQAAAAIDHPNIVPVYAAGDAEGNLYLAMRFVEGWNLNQVLDSHGPFDLARATEVLARVADALDAAHAAGLVHRDVTPANILIEGEPGEESVYLTDFGLVRGLERDQTRLTRTDQVIANLDYAAPEQIQGGQVDARTDVYALGCVLYRMLSGERPFPGTDTQKMWKIVHEPVPPLGPGPSPLDPVIARATAKVPERRFASAGDLYRAATEPEAAVTAPLPRSGGAPPGAPPPRRRRNRPLIIGAAAAAVLVGAVAAAVLIAGGGGGDGGDSRTVVRETTVTVPTGPQQQRSSAPEEADPPAEAKAQPLPGTEASLEPFTGAVYVTAIPDGWVQDGEVVEEAPYHANLWQGVGEPGEPYVRVEGNFPAPEPDAVLAGEESRANTSESDGYRELYYGRGELDGREGLRWEYEVDGDRRIVYGFVECNVNLATVGSALPERYSDYLDLFDEVAAATHTRCTE